MLQRVISWFGRYKVCIHIYEQAKEPLWKLRTKENVEKCHWYWTHPWEQMVYHCSMCREDKLGTNIRYLERWGEGTFREWPPRAGELWLGDWEPSHGTLSRGFTYLRPDDWASLCPQRCLQAEYIWKLKEASGSCSLSWVKGKVVPSHFTLIWTTRGAYAVPAMSVWATRSTAAGTEGRRWGHGLLESSALWEIISMSSYRF